MSTLNPIGPAARAVSWSSIDSSAGAGSRCGAMVPAPPAPTTAIASSGPVTQPISASWMGNRQPSSSVTSPCLIVSVTEVVPRSG